jgi:dUTP pyrophosphatase
MRKATELVLGKRYYDEELDDYFYIVSFKVGTPDVLVKYDCYANPEIFTYADMLEYAFTDEPEALLVPIKSMHDDAIIPEYKSEGAAGFDLHITEDVTIPANSIIVGYKSNYAEKHLREAFSNMQLGLANNNHAMVGTGLAFEIPIGHEMEIRDRSGNFFKDIKVLMFNGTIDSDFRGEVKLMITNLGSGNVTFKKGDRVAQGVIKKIDQVVFVQTTELSDTVRGDKGFNSTGLNK